MNAETPEKKSTGKKASEAKDTGSDKDSQARPSKSGDKAEAARSRPSQDMLLLFGKLIDRKALEDKEKEELVDIIFDLNAELVRTTTRLGLEKEPGAFKIDRDVKKFVRVPAGPGDAPADREQLQSTWRIVLVSSRPSHKPLGLEIWAPAIIGRKEGDITPQIDLGDYDAADLGVSRWHALLRPTKTGLLLTDLRSTNGTFHNATKLQPGMVQKLADGDTLAFGHLTFQVRIARHPDAAGTDRLDPNKANKPGRTKPRL